MANACLFSGAPPAPAQAAGTAGHEWFAVQVWTGREQRSAAELAMRGYEVFLPCYREHRRWSDRIKKVDRALFPGYLFCRCARDEIGTAIPTAGVIGIVSAGSEPLAVPAADVEAIQRVVSTRLLIEPWAFLSSGQRVRIETGPLRGTEGIVIALRNTRRLILSVAMVQRSVAVELDPSWVSVPPESLLA